MDAITLVPVSPAYARQIEAYRAAFPVHGMQATPDADRIPGLDRLEEFDSVDAWLQFCAGMQGKISWYLAVRQADQKIVGCIVLRRRLEYDDDDPEFCSHIGYSVRPDERRKGYAKELLRRTLIEARRAGLTSVRLICRAENTGSVQTILANGGALVDTIRGEESGMTVNRYDIALP